MQPTIESVNQKHKDILALIDAFEKTIPSMSDIGRMYAPGHVTNMRTLCSLAMGPLSANPFPFLNPSKTGLPRVDAIEAGLAEQVAAMESDFLKESIVSANKTLDDAITAINEARVLYK